MASDGGAELFEGLPEQAAPEPASGGLPRLRFAERDQIAWRPVSLDGLLADDHRVRLVWDFVEGLDLAARHATIKAVDGRPGHPPADPRILLALWLYATVEGIGSAREIARLCDEHIAFQWLCGGVGMNAKTLADFRVDHGAVLERLLVDSFTALVRGGSPAWIAWPRMGCGCAPRQELPRFAGIRPCRIASARRKKRWPICAHK
jgi:transposase